MVSWLNAIRLALWEKCCTINCIGPQYRWGEAYAALDELNIGLLSDVEGEQKESAASSEECREALSVWLSRKGKRVASHHPECKLDADHMQKNAKIVFPPLRVVSSE